MASCLFVAVAACGVVYADQIVSANDNYPGAKITGFEQGRLAFRTADGQSRDVWISDVDMMVVDRGGIFDDFNQGERFVSAGEPDRAIIRYRRTLRLSESFWSDLIACRLVVACDRAERIDQATLNFIRVVRGKWAGPQAAARLIPTGIAPTRTPEAVRAIEHLDAAIAENPGEAQLLPLWLARFQILSHVGDERQVKAARTVASTAIPESMRCEGVYTIQLAALELLGEGGFSPADFANLDQAIQGCTDELLPSFLLLKGRMLLGTAESRDDINRATWPFMRIVAHMPDDPRAADGLYEAALALDRMGLRDKAMGLLEECLAHTELRAETQRRANEALARLRSANTASR